MSQAVLHAFRNLTPRDADLRYFEDPRARQLIEAQILLFPSWALPDPQTASCVVGIVPNGRVGEVWMITGEGFEGHAKIILGIGRQLCRTMYEVLKLHRMDMRCRTDYPQAGRWAQALGLEYETTLKRAGAQGENIDVYLWPDERGAI